MQGFCNLEIGQVVYGPLGTTTGALITSSGIDRAFRKKTVLIGIVLTEQKPESDQCNRYEHEGELSPQISSSSEAGQVRRMRG